MGLKFSVVIPVKPHQGEVPVLESLKKMDYPQERYEVIIEEGPNPSLNRNRGIKKAKGEILAFVDDDCFVDTHWLKNAERFIEEHKVDALGGPQLTPPTDNLLSKASGHVLSSFFGSYKMSKRYKRGEEDLNADELSLTSANLFVKREVFSEIAPFNSQLYPNEETELISRMRENHYKITYSPEVVVYHKRRPTFSAFFKQCMGYGAGRGRQNIIKGKHLRIFILIPIGFLLYLISLPFLANINPLSLSLLAIYGILNSSFSTLISIRNRDLRLLPLLSLLFFIVHLAYPLGIVKEYITHFGKKTFASSRHTT